MKFCKCCDSVHIKASPSMRREWIEILSQLFQCEKNFVSLHAEGVD